MKVKNVEIKNVGGIKELKISFSGAMNIICGPNGIGKSTILDAIAFMFSRHATNIKKNVMSEEVGSIKIAIIINDSVSDFVSNIEVFAPSVQMIFNNEIPDIRYLIRFDTERNLPYTRLASIGEDPRRDEEVISYQNNKGVSYNDLKGWLGKRFLLEDSQKGIFTENSKRNLSLALSCITQLNSDYCFSHIDGRNFDIFVNTPNGIIWYEYLSSGFKSCIAIIIGIIQEIELRFVKEDIYAADFDGIIIIDEIEMHLHPDWQARITEVMTAMFPQTQFIVTTHSPHVVQNGKPEQIIALEQSESGETKIRSHTGYENGYTGWTIDEVLRDVMGMESTLSKELEHKLQEFYHYIDAEDHENARVSYKYLDAILHPKNVLRKSLSMSIDMLEDSGEDL